MTSYAKMLSDIKPIPERCAGMSRAEIESEIVKVTAAMKGSMTNVERALLYADRKDLRAALALRVK